MTADILCIGSVLWDVIGRAPVAMPQGADLPGRIVRQPGGVALNIAMTLLRMGLRPALLSVVGRDAPGDELLAHCAGLGIDVSHVHRCDGMATDRYLAIEAANGLIAAIADAHTLEAAGGHVLAPLADGRLGSARTPYRGPVAVDGNLTAALLEEIAQGPAFAAADLRVAPASPGKAERLLPFLRHRRGTLYVNLQEAGLLCGTRFTDAAEAARALIARGARRALVTDGAGPAADAVADVAAGVAAETAETAADAGSVLTGLPPQVPVTRLTGAGDTFMAAHMAAETAGAPRAEALTRALRAAARHVSSGLAS